MGKHARHGDTIPFPITGEPKIRRLQKLGGAAVHTKTLTQNMK